ncbi:MAG: hypothetical protein HY819_16420 [Acidobacteria bacterium]|nr:hypothetical protein [Acidobacteriota bacterium]
MLIDNSFSSPRVISRWRYVPFKELSEAGISCKYDDEKNKEEKPKGKKLEMVVSSLDQIEILPFCEESR